MRYRAVIFDLDGVLCHTDQYHYQAWKQIADKLGVEFDETINHRLRGVSRMKSFEIILEKYHGSLSDEEKRAYVQEKNAIYKRLLMKMTPSELSTPVRETLRVLKKKGIRMAIGSSSKNAGFILKQIGMERFFDAVSDGNNITKSKPDPEVFIKASQMLDIAPECCLVVEDAKTGLEAAIACGMDCAAMGDAASCGLATYKLSTFSDLLKII